MNPSEENKMNAGAFLPHQISASSPFSLASAPKSSSSAPSNSNGASSASRNQLDGNSFITLLTAQLQAQDPLNPLDPNQMVSELTSMNTLQQTIQIREDLDALVKSSQTAAPQSARDAAALSRASALSSSNPSTIAHNAELAAARFALAHANSKL
jgi:flagellar basal-body rod modification protein FlgD